MMAERDAERRLRRSEDPITALHYQLAHARHQAGLQAMVLVDDCGGVVAGAGAWPLCEELAAFAPLLVDTGALIQTAAATAVDALRSEVSLRPLSLNGAEVLLAARGQAGADIDDSLSRAARGCLRILGAASAAG
jgi:hypothetical protein